jgi:hypothetical protein
MMTMLRRQGMSAKVILGGLGESAAYLGVQLQMAPTDAAEFAATAGRHPDHQKT